MHYPVYSILFNLDNIKDVFDNEIKLIIIWNIIL